MVQNLPEIRSRLGHGLRSGLAKSDAVPLAGTFQNQVIAICFYDERTAGDRIPAKAPIDVQPRGLV